MTKLPKENAQFRVLYREFLFRMVDLEVLAPQGDMSKLLGQFAGLLIFVSFWLAYFTTAIAGSQKGSLAGVLVIWTVEHFLIATTMLAVGFFTVMSWDATFPDRRDVLVLSPLPIRSRTLLLAKAAGVASALSITVLALNAFTGLIEPFVFASGQGFFLPALRSLAAYWITMLGAGVFIFGSVLGVQGLAQLLPRQWFLRVSSWLQTVLFFLWVTVYVLQPPFSEVGDLVASQRVLRWLPSYWFFGLFQQLQGFIAPELAFLARRAWTGLAVAGCSAAAAYLICYFRTLRKIAEQPDILPGQGGRSVLGAGLPRFGNSLETAVGHFSVRTLLRSRQHRVILSFYLGTGLGLGMFIAKVPELYQAASARGAWYRANAPLLVASILIVCAAVLGTRVVFSMPLEVRANWIFRVMPLPGTPACLAAGRRSLYALAVAPILAGSAALFLWLWPWKAALGHLAYLVLLATILAELCLHGFHKLPFTCSYLPGKTQFHMAVMYLALLLITLSWAAEREMDALSSGTLYAIVLLGLAAVAVLARWRTTAGAKSEEVKLQFDEAPAPAIFALDLHRDGITPFE